MAGLAVEERAWLAEARKLCKRKKDSPGPPQSLVDKMQGQADVIAFLESPAGAEAREMLAVDQDGFEARYADACDEENRCSRTARRPIPPSRDRTMGDISREGASR